MRKRSFYLFTFTDEYFLRLYTVPRCEDRTKDFGSFGEGLIPSGTTTKYTTSYMATYQITYHDDCVIIWDSYKIRELSKMRQVLKYIKETHPGILNNRSEFSMLNEWRSHNLLYNLKILRNRTKDVNINYKLPLWAEIGYTILSPFYFHFR